MRKLFSMAILAALMVILADAAMAQRQGGFGRGGNTGVALLVNKSVQEELKITDEQKKKLEGVTAESRKQREEVVGKFDFKDKDSFAKVLEAMKDEKNQAKLKEIEKTALKSALEILTADQAKRFKQIDIQQMGLRAFADEEIAKTLALTDDQKAKIKEISEEINKDLGDLQKEAFKDKSGDTRKKMTALRKEGLDKAAAALTSEQKSKWKDMVGEPFEVRFEGGFTRPTKGKDKVDD